ncbi:hypothetical protein [Nocardioides pinisoli]|uniref:Uncharacterized protein n=1 Tax=Nocardioides pinisoli TaxID=2950279 RepID=A0ABT1L041_9ACTN|nr:hypothetical protein [Nocardioides pinisoli]MCP3422969.1 hypothetical protein [Nocardioides pinisoli]
MPENSTRVRHAVSRSTGATTWTRKDGDEWRTTCLNHGAETTASARGQAWKNGSTPANFCSKCKAIVAGKAEKITEGRLDLPAPKAKKPATKKTAATTTVKKAARVSAA